MRSHVYISVLAASIAVASGANAEIIYDSTVAPRYYTPSDPTPLHDTANTVDTTRILYDDVPVHTGAILNPSLNVTSVRFDIVQKHAASAVNVSGFWSPMEPDGAHDGGLDDGPNDDPNSANSLGSPIALSANPGADRIVSIIFSTPFNTGVLSDTQSPTGDPRFFLVGLSFDNTDTLNGWELADQPENIDLLWDYKSQTDLAEYGYPVDPQGDPIIGTLAAKISGSLVPEPGIILSVVGVGALFLGRRARRA